MKPKTRETILLALTALYTKRDEEARRIAEEIPRQRLLVRRTANRVAKVYEQDKLNKLETSARNAENELADVREALEEARKELGS